MDDVKLMPAATSMQHAAVDAAPTAEGLAKRFFVLTMIGIVVYISAILLLMSTAN